MQMLEYLRGKNVLGFAKSSISAVGRLIAAAALMFAFAGGLVAVVYYSLSGKEVSVPDITGKDFYESEKELASLGLKIKRRAERVSDAKMNTVLEQLPKPGETVKTGQMILVVVSKAPAPGDVPPPSLKKDINEDDTQKIEEMISDKPKKVRPATNSNSNSNSNANSRKADTTRDVISNVNSVTPSANTAPAANSDIRKPQTEEKPRNSTDKNDKTEKGDRREPQPKTGTTPPAARQPNRNN